MIPMFSFPIPATSPIPAAPAAPPVPAGRLQILLLCLAGAARTGRLGRLHGCRFLFGVWRLYSVQRATVGIPGYPRQGSPHGLLSLFTSGLGYSLSPPGYGGQRAAQGFSGYWWLSQRVIATRGEHGRNAIRAALSAQSAASGKPPSPLWCTLRDCPVAPYFLWFFCFKEFKENPENRRLRRWWFSDRLEEFLCGCMATLGLVVKNST